MVLSVLLYSVRIQWQKNYVRMLLLLDWTGGSGIVDIGIEKHQ
jgi:hypothetical protein